MECNHILVRFGELTTKGKNRKTFIRKLCHNTKEILKSFDKLKYELSFDRMYIILNGEEKLRKPVRISNNEQNYINRRQAYGEAPCGTLCGVFKAQGGTAGFRRI